MKLSPAELKLEKDKVQDNKFNQYVKRITLKMSGDLMRKL